MCAVIKNNCLFFCGVSLWAGPTLGYCLEELRFYKDFAAMRWMNIHTMEKRGINDAIVNTLSYILILHDLVQLFIFSFLQCRTLWRSSGIFCPSQCIVWTVGGAGGTDLLSISSNTLKNMSRYLIWLNVTFVWDTQAFFQRIDWFWHLLYQGHLCYPGWTEWPSGPNRPQVVTSPASFPNEGIC